MKDFKKEEIKYRMIVSTDTLVETFYMEACAYVTGQIGQCNVGTDKKFNAPAEHRAMFERVMERRMCVDSYWRPAFPCVDDMDSFELYFKERPTREMVDIIRAGCNEFADEMKEKFPITKRIQILDIVVIKERTLFESMQETYEVLV
jgi:hypothetical protein